MDHDVSSAFESETSWREFVASHDWVDDASFREYVARHARVAGISSHAHGHTRDVSIAGAHYRETLVAHGLNARMRALLDEVIACANGSAEILMLEALLPFSKAVLNRFPKTLATEYLPTAEQRREYYPIPHCDICNADFPSACFDMVLSGDVLEHVPDLDAALREMYRLLRPAGLCLATVPFRHKQSHTVTRARKSNGVIQHLVEPPIYHANHLDTEGALVFAVPAWDLLDRARTAGFVSARMDFISSVPRAIVGNDVGGVFVFRAQA